MQNLLMARQRTHTHTNDANTCDGLLEMRGGRGDNLISKLIHYKCQQVLGIEREQSENDKLHSPKCRWM